MDNAKFMTLAEAKEFFGTSTLNVKLNPATGKKFVLLPCGSVVKIQQDLDPKLPVAIMTTVFDELGDPDFYEGCFINVKSNLEDQFSL